MKNASFVKNNKSKINSSHPYSFKEINSTPNYLYMQIKNGLHNNKRPNGKSPKGSNSSLKKFPKSYSNISNISNMPKAKPKYSFYNQNLINNIRSTSQNKSSYTQNSKNFNSDYSINQHSNNFNKNRNNSERNIYSDPYQNIRDNSFMGYGYRPKSKNSPSPLIKRNRNNINASFSLNKNNKNERNKTPILNKQDNINNIHKISSLDNSINLNLGISNNNRIYNKNNKNNNWNKNRTNSELNRLTKSNNMHYSKAFQPKNIFSQFKKKKAPNTGYSFGYNKFLLSSNNPLLNGSSVDETKNSNKNIKKNEPEKMNITPQNNINNSQTQNSIKTNDTSALQINSNLLSNGTTSNNNISKAQIAASSNYNINHQYNQSLNVDCHEIDINLSGIPRNEQISNNNVDNMINNENKNKNNSSKVWKGKKIKCMHDISKTGLSGDDKKVNQDNFFIFKNFVHGFENIYMGVCDGHGYYGHEVSGYIKENLPMDLNHALKKNNINLLTDDLSTISPIIKQCFINENKCLLRNRQIDSDLSGTTCISVIYTPQKLIIANIGDSRCVLGKYKDGKWITENLSRDHKPTIPEEQERILKVGGRIHPMRDEDGDFIGPLRVYMKDKEMPGLAMTRSFGDYFGSTAGTISEPEVTEHILSEEDKFIVIASDGLYEFIQSEEVIEYVREFYERNDIVGCCEFLYKESCRKWLDEEEDTIDDITIILVFFEDYYE